VYAIPASVPYVWAVLAAAVLVAIWLGIRQESRWFAAHGKGRPWCTLRICTIPITIATAGAVIVVTRSVKGPEALFAFYAMLLTGAPLVYFTLHWIVGRYLEPRLTGGETAWIGFSGLMIVLGPAALASAMHPWVFLIARSIG
jgi:hypothetical protein